MTKEEYDRNNGWGLLTCVDLHDCNPDTIRNAEKIRQFVYALCEKIDVQRFGECQVVHFADHNEDVAGFSMVQLIETSLVSGHFANKSNSVYLDVFSCKFYEVHIVVDYAAEFFEAKNHRHTVVLRK